MISFAEFTREVHGAQDRTPYPWQERFAERCASGTLPELVGVPTGCGKTTVVDALVWALACQAELPPAERSVGARIIWAIDRRILVDEVHAHASVLSERLLAARDRSSDPLHETAAKLTAMSGDEPLVTRRWRGGIASDPAPLAPTQPQVITSTVAQIGSRMLFRGYGVGRRSLSIEAGLATCDTTVCLDEAHLAEPFRQTVSAIRARRAETERELDLPKLGLVTLTATPGDEHPDAVLLGEDDRMDPRLERRLQAKKWARLEEEPPTERDRISFIADRAVTYIDDGAPTVACVVNTVKRARAVFDLLARELADRKADRLLLVGPQRPADREQNLAEHGPVLFGGALPQRPLVCVATQTFEVGLDADVAAMVTDSASAAALVQRLGRLNRRGQCAGRVTIVRERDSWLYEKDEALAWDWLRSREDATGAVDVSVAALEADRSRPLPTRVRSAPLLTSATIELLVQTNPQPGRWQEPSVEGLLRGAEEPTATDVTLCWRRDLLPFLRDPAAEGYREMLLTLVPPQQREQLPLSLTAARALLAARYPAGGSPARAAAIAVADTDVEVGSEPTGVPEAAAPDISVPFLVVRPREVLHGALSDDGDRVTPGSLQPGDTIVLPAEAGGVDRFGLAPGAGQDLEAGDVAADLRKTVSPENDPLTSSPVRISPAALGEPGRAKWFKIKTKCRAVSDDVALLDRPDEVEHLVDELAVLLPDHRALAELTSELRTGPSDIRPLLRALGPAGRDGAPMLEDEEIEAIEGDSDDRPGSADLGADTETSAEASAYAQPDPLERTWVIVPVRDGERERRGRDRANPPPTLDSHARAVREQVERFTSGRSLPAYVRSALSIAAAAHDHGKADPRTQAFFRGGVRPLGAPPIAKSVFGTDDPRTERLARATAGAPKGLSHEIASVAVLAGWLAEKDDSPEVDHDLALHLVASHHGQGRPIPRIPAGGDDPIPFYVDAAGVYGSAVGDGQDGWADGEWLQRFWKVIDQYGEWGTAYLEALLVLADRTVSARGD